MTLTVIIIFCFLVLGVSSQRWATFLKEAGQGPLQDHSGEATLVHLIGRTRNFRAGAKDLWMSYSDMRGANYKDSNTSMTRGTIGSLGCQTMPERTLRVTDLFQYGDSGHGVEDSKADQAANRWGRSGNNPNHFRPAGLPDKY